MGRHVIIIFYRLPGFARDISEMTKSVKELYNVVN